MAEESTRSTHQADSATTPKLAAHLMMFASATTPQALNLALHGIARCGLDGVEIPLTSDLIDASTDLAEQADEAGLAVIASTVLPSGGDIGSESASDRRSGLTFLHKAIDQAANIGSPVLGGVIHQPSRAIPIDARTSRRRRHMIAALKEAVAHADQVGVRLAVEPTTRFLTSEINTVQEALDLRREVGDSLGILLDTYHLAAEEADPVDAVARGIPAAVFIQINESTRGVFGEGAIDWQRFADTLHAAKYGGWLSFEAFPRSSAWAERAFSWRALGTADEIVRSGLTALGFDRPAGWRPPQNGPRDRISTPGAEATSRGRGSAQRHP